MKNIVDRIKALRLGMKTAGVNAFYIPGTDPHLSEYVPAHWQSRPFISGFTGSAGLIIVTLHEAALWTDSRYFIQAEKELAGTGIKLMRERQPNTPTPSQWLGKQLNKDEKLGIDASCISINQFKNFQEELSTYQIQVTAVADLLDKVWDDRPEFPANPIYEHNEKFCGNTRSEKLDTLRQHMQQQQADYLLITALDDLAWTFNLRGSDVEYNPVFVGYAVIGINETWLFTGIDKLGEKLTDKLKADGIKVTEYASVFSFLSDECKGKTILIDPDKTNQLLLEYLQKTAKSVYQLSAPTLLKACKTEKEIAHIRNAMRKDGAAMVNFLFWLDQTLLTKRSTELDVAHQLTNFRSLQQNFVGESFFPIVGYSENGAIVHYHVNKESAKEIQPNGFLLLDSGGQYLDGTTDITRTIALSEPSMDEKKDFTLVLKGMIALSRAIFPEGTKGCNLDTLARKALWEQGLNYGHGTGHGVGYFLNVHEGPMSIRQDYNPHAIQPGMVLSNEPGLYREGRYGIRTENLIACIELPANETGRFLGFETLTLCPIDLKAVDRNLLNKDETDWLNNYHERVYCELGLLLESEQTAFLREITKPL